MIENSDLRVLSQSIDALAPQVPALRDKLTDVEIGLGLVKEEQAGVRTMLRRVVVVIVAAIITIGSVFSAFLYSVNRQSINNERAIVENNRKQDARWCPLLVEIGPRPGDPEPVGNAEQQERANRVRAGLRYLTAQYDCTIPNTQETNRP